MLRSLVGSEMCIRDSPFASVVIRILSKSEPVTISVLPKNTVSPDERMTADAMPFCGRESANRNENWCAGETAGRPQPGSAAEHTINNAVVSLFMICSGITSAITGRRQVIFHFKTHGLRRSVCIALLSRDQCSPEETIDSSIVDDSGDDMKQARPKAKMPPHMAHGNIGSYPASGRFAFSSIRD